MNDSYLLVEGPQDVYFVGRILQELGLRSAQRPEDIPAKWEPFIDKPTLDRDRAQRAAKREAIPFWLMFKLACLFSDTHAVVIEQVGGNRTRFGRTLRATNELIEGGLAGLTGVGILPDADLDPPASLASARQALQAVGLSASGTNQEVINGTPNTGIFVLPGGEDRGGLEELLIDCAEGVYPNLLAGAREFVSGVNLYAAEYLAEDVKEMRTPQGPVKAVIGSISSVLQPGSTIQVSIHRNRWVSDKTMALPRIAAVTKFLTDLCGIK